MPRPDSFRGMSSILEHPNVMPEPNSGCWIWIGNRNRGGYGHVRFRGQFMVAHRVSLALIGIEVPKGKIVCHKCNNRSCVNPDHLYVGTYSDNMRDAVAAGTLQRRFKGEKHPGARLTEDHVRNIRASYLGGCKREFAEEFGKKLGVSFCCVLDVINNRSWTHI